MDLAQARRGCSIPGVGIYISCKRDRRVFTITVLTPTPLTLPGEVEDPKLNFNGFFFAEVASVGGCHQRLV